VPGVTVLNIDDLEGIVQTNLNERLSEADNVRQIIAEGLVQFAEWMNVKRVVPTITALTRRADEIRDEELARSSDVLGKLSQEDRRRVEALTRAIQKKLLHPSIMALRTSAASGDGLETSRVVSSLFGLNPADESSGLEEAS
jgi:glutamyl-tRNA reductase